MLFDVIAYYSLGMTMVIIVFPFVLVNNYDNAFARSPKMFGVNRA